jgi:hypothetical protein
MAAASPVYPPAKIVQIDGPLKETLCEGVILGAGFTEMPQTSLIGGPDIEAGRRLSQSAVLLGVGNRWGNSDRHSLSDLVLQRKDVGEIAVVALGPDVLASLGLDQLRSDADAIAGLAYAAFEHIAHTELAPNLLHIDRAALVSEAGVARDDEQRGIAGQRGDDVLGDPVGHELLLGIPTHVGKGQHGH